MEKKSCSMLQSGDQIGIVCCSNAQKRSDFDKMRLLEEDLLQMGLHPVFSHWICEKENASGMAAMERARALMDFYKDDGIKGIFDISGGDIANGILPYLDYNVIAESPKLFWGYSDLTTVINAIYEKTRKASVLYQIRNLICDHGEEQTVRFRNTVLNGADDLFQIRYRFIRRGEMRGVVVGGNIRCFLKLAGTEFMPDLTGRILLLESFSGTVPQVAAYLSQLQQMGALEKAAGILLGTFTQMDMEKCIPTVETLLCDVAGGDLPIAVTQDIGHGTDSRGILIGRELHLIS